MPIGASEEEAITNMSQRKSAAAMAMITGVFALSLSASELNPDEPKYPNIVKPELTIGKHAIGLGERGDLISPRGIVFRGNAEVLISDCAKNTIELYDFDPIRKTATWRESWGQRGDGVGEFRCPAAIDVDSDGHVYVVDAGNRRVQVLDEKGKAIRTIGGDTMGAVNTLFNPVGLDLTDGRLYVTDPGYHRVLVFATDGKFLFSFGTKGQGQGEFLYPSGIVLDDEGRVFVADTYNHRIQRFSSDGKYLSEWGEFGSFPGDMAGPVAVSYTNGEIMVADSVNHRIQVFAVDGEYLYQFARHPTERKAGDGRIHYPIATAFDGTGKLAAVCEKFEGRCQVFDRVKARQSFQDVRDSAWWDKYPFFHYRTSAQILRKPSSMFRSLQVGDPQSWLVMSEEELHRVVIMNMKDPTKSFVFGGQGTEPGRFNLPQGAHADPQGRIWVSDTLNDRLQILSADGRDVEVVGGPGTGPLEFSQPGEIVIDSDGMAYVLDPGNSRIQVINSKAEFVREIHKPGDGKDSLNYPIGLALNPDGTIIYVVELYRARIQSFTTEGRFLASWGQYGDRIGDVILACHVAVDSLGYVYVTDDALNRVTKFSPRGEALKMWGYLGNGPGQFYHPQGIAVDDRDQIWIIDYGNHRGQVFDTEGRFISVFGEGLIGSDRAFPQSE